MKVPISWLKEYIKVPKDIKELTHNLTMVGHMLDKIEEGKGRDVVIDLELRGNRADCYSIYGIAREISAIYNTPLKVPPLKVVKNIKSLKEIKLSVKSRLVKRVVMTTIKDAKIIPSPMWLKNALNFYGLDSINNIVDLTNYVAIELGSPLHAFDLAKIGKKLVIRQAKKNESITTFQNTSLRLSPDDLVWANENEVLSVAGAIGSKKHSVSLDTKDILVESASYDRASVRRTVHRHNLFTEAGIRHEKDLDPNLSHTAVSRFLYLMEKNKWGKPEKLTLDYYPTPIKPWRIKLNYSNLESLTGTPVKENEVKDIVKRLSFTIYNSNKIDLTVGVPTYRTDVKNEADLIEEVIRIYGYEKIPTSILAKEIPEQITPDFIEQEDSIRNQLTSLGFSEVISLSFVKESIKSLNKLESKLIPITIENPPSPDYQEMRLTLLPNLIELGQKAINERAEVVKYFEIGKVYGKRSGRFEEYRRLGILYHNNSNSTYTHFKGYLEAFLEEIGVKAVFDTSDIINLTDGFTVYQGKTAIGYGGLYKNLYFAQFNLENLEIKNSPKVNLWPKYPPQIEDVTFKFPEKTKIGEVLSFIKISRNVTDSELIGTYKNSYTFRFWYQDKNKTLDDKEVEILRNTILKGIEKKFGGIVKD